MKRIPLKMLICVKNDLYREALSGAIQNRLKGFFEIKESCGDLNTALKLSSLLELNFFLLEFDSNDLNPVPILKSYHINYPNTKIIVLTFFENETYNELLLSNGASAIYLIGSDISNLINILTK